MENANPTILSAADLPTRKPQKPRSTLLPRTLPPPLLDPFDIAPANLSSESDEDDLEGEDFDPIDAQEIYDLIAPISDPEHPLSLGALAVVNLPHIYIREDRHPPTVLVEFTPTITHCSLATVIGLGIRVRLERALPPRYRVDVRVREGTHSTADQVNRQLGDKERVAAACENDSLMRVLGKMLEGCN